jgi:hypothetical protein
MAQGASQTPEKPNQEKSDIDEIVETLSNIPAGAIRYPWLMWLSMVFYMLAVVGVIVSFWPTGASWPRTEYLVSTIVLIGLGLLSGSAAQRRWLAVLGWLLAGLGWALVTEWLVVESRTKISPPLLWLATVLIAIGLYLTRRDSFPRSRQRD